MLAACDGAGGPGGGDALGLQSVTRPALGVLDALYATQAVLDELWAEHGDDLEGWPDEVVASLQRRAAAVTAQVERYVCSVPRDKCAVLGARAVLVLARGREDEAPSFLSARSGEEDAGRRAGSELAASKARELESILTASDDGRSSAFLAAPTGSRGADAFALDRSREVESLLAGGGFGSVPDPWASDFQTSAAAAAEPAANAFLEPASPAFATARAASKDATPRIGGGGFNTWFGSDAAAAGAGATSPAVASPRGGGGLGGGSVLQTWVADPSQREELSVFEGDRVEVLQADDGWYYVRDPGGSQGYVPEWNVTLDTPQAAQHAQQGRTHRRNESLDYSRSKEDYLDTMFSAGGGYGAGAMPPTPEHEPLGGGGGGRSFSAGGDDPFAAVRRSDSQQPLRQDSDSAAWDEEGLALGGGLPLSPLGGGGGMFASPTPQSAASTGAAGNPFGGPGHRRSNSVASSAGGAHRRTLSGASGDFPSAPGSPLRLDGPERAVAAAFAAEMEGELSVEAGDRVRVHSEVAGWARVVRSSDGRSGLVPSWAVAE